MDKVTAASVVEFLGEGFHPWPDCRVDNAAQRGPFGEVPRAEGVALTGYGVFAEWRKPIPDALVTALLRFRRIYRWGILLLATRMETAGSPVERTVRIMDQFPGYVVYFLWLRHVRRMIEIEDFLRPPPTVVRHASLLPVAIFRRVKPRDAEIGTLQMLEESWRSRSLPAEVRRALVHCKRITHDTALCLRLPPPVVSPALITACEGIHEQEVYAACNRILAITRGAWPYENVSKPETLFEISWRLEQHCDHLDFPRPPFPGEDGIVPLDSRTAVRREADEMQHCLSSTLMGSLVLGERAAYAVSLAAADGTIERATAVLKRAADASDR